MKRIGITGGVGCGKTTLGNLLLKRRFRVIDVDDIARELTSSSTSAASELIVERFGTEILGPEGQINRAKLASITFASSENRKALESILHPIIRSKWLARVEDWEREGVSSCFVVVPLLFEVGLGDYFTKVVCVACSLESQFTRLRNRGWSDEDSSARMFHQISVSKKMALADWVIWTDTTPRFVEAQLDELIRLDFCSDAAGAC